MRSNQLEARRSPRSPSHAHERPHASHGPHSLMDRHRAVPRAAPATPMGSPRPVTHTHTTVSARAPAPPQGHRNRVGASGGRHRTPRSPAQHRQGGDTHTRVSGGVHVSPPATPPGSATRARMYAYHSTQPLTSTTPPQAASASETPAARLRTPLARDSLPVPVPVTSRTPPASGTAGASSAPHARSGTGSLRLSDTAERRTRAHAGSGSRSALRLVRNLDSVVAANRARRVNRLQV